MRRHRLRTRLGRSTTVGGTGDGAPPVLVSVGGRALTVALVGSRCWVADALAQALTAGGDHVVRLDRVDGAGDPPGLTTDDGEDDRATAGCGADVVVHLATGPRAPSLRGRSEPALQTLAALHAARADGARLVIASLPGNAARLRADEALAAGFRSAHDVETVVVELAECYGPGMPAGRTGALARMLHQARTDGVVVVEAGDDVEHRVCFVDDALAGLLRVVRGAGGGPFRLAPGTGIPTLELARAVAEATGTSLRVRERRRLRVAAVHAAVPVDGPTDPVVPAGTAPDGWRCEVDLAEGLARCLQAEGLMAPLPTGGPGLPDLGRSGAAATGALGGDVA